MRLAFVCALAFVTAVAACGPSSGPGDDTNPPMTLTIAPAMVTLESVDMAAVSQDFTVKATYADGEIEDVTALVAWNVESQYGSMDGPRFTTYGRVGGVATLTAILDNVTGTAQIEINVRATIIDPSAPANAPDLFGSGTIDPSRAPTIVYPANEVVVPSNIGAFDVHWQDASTNDVWEVSLRSAHSDVRIYVGATSPRWLQFAPLQWQMASANEDHVEAHVRGVSTLAPGLIGDAAPVRATPADTPIAGGLYYWTTGFGGACNGVCGIYRHDVSQPEVPAERFYAAPDLEGRCVACHTLSRDGTKMAFTYDGGDGAGSVLDVGTRTAQPSPGVWNFATFTPDAARLITAIGGGLEIRDTATGATIGAVPVPGFATQPDFAPTGAFIAYTTTPAPVSTNIWFNSGSIVVQPYDGTNYGTPTTIVPSAGENNYYPSVSPDGAWVAFNRSTGDSYDDPDAEPWVVASTGGTPVRLGNASITPGLSNSWVRWAPFEQTVHGERMFWLTFSTRRQFGVRLAQGIRPQIWMAAFFPDRAAAGMDPSGPAFWLPFQDLETSNHIAQWTEQVIPIE
jgi:hypothetical protein